MNGNAAPLLEQGVPETIELVANLLTEFMGTPDGVWQIYNQRRRLPAAKGFFGDVAILGHRPFAVKRKYVNDPAQPDLVESLSANVQEMIQIDIFSYDDSARLRKTDVLFALASTAMESLAERWAFKVARIPSTFVDASRIEGSARLNWFSLTFNVLRAYGRTSTAPTFSVFQNPPKQILVNP